MQGGKLSGLDFPNMQAWQVLAKLDVLAQPGQAYEHHLDIPQPASAHPGGRVKVFDCHAQHLRQHAHLGPYVAVAHYPQGFAPDLIAPLGHLFPCPSAHDSCFKLMPHSLPSTVCNKRPRKAGSLSHMGFLNVPLASGEEFRKARTAEANQAKTGPGLSA